MPGRLHRENEGKKDVRIYDYMIYTNLFVRICIVNA